MALPDDSSSPPPLPPPPAQQPPPLPHPPSFSSSQHQHNNSTSTSIFSRRPSFFGGRSSKVPKTPTASVPPVIHLPPVSQTSPLDALPPSVAFPDQLPPKAAAILTTPPRHTKTPSRHSISSTLGDFGVQLQRSRSASIRTNGTNDSSGNTSTHTSSSHKRAPSSTVAQSLSPDKNASSVSTSTSASAAPTPLTNGSSNTSRPTLSISTFSRNKQKSSSDLHARPDTRQGLDKSAPLSSSLTSSRYSSATKSDLQQARRPQEMHSGGLGPAAPIALQGGSNSSSPHAIFQHIQEMASKRISTLDYLRKSHEGRIYWFNTLLFSKQDLTRLPSFTPRNLARRATHYLLLGFSLPTILDLNSSSPTEYLKALNALLLEFEQYQSIHPADGSAPSGLTRGRIPGMQMFKRANIGGKGRRSSSAADGFPTLASQLGGNDFLGGGGGAVGGAGAGLGSSLDPTPENDLLLPNESYSYLQTPSLPFDPDFFSTFATLCDVLIDCYTKILGLLNSPEAVVLAGNGFPVTVAELFNKADARVRKIILAGVVREFEESCRQGVKAEVGGVGKVVLGGLM